mmetsp:Transcript_46299/g.75578  ORF Transcript_46299/g.75578 Transcript_46299/m.75578 type:complete len:218 (-) Transcript_46299:1203-1856(-)
MIEDNPLCTVGKRLWSLQKDAIFEILRHGQILQELDSQPFKHFLYRQRRKRKSFRYTTQSNNRALEILQRLNKQNGSFRYTPSLALFISQFSEQERPFPLSFARRNHIRHNHLILGRALLLPYGSLPLPLNSSLPRTPLQQRTRVYDHIVSVDVFRGAGRDQLLLLYRSRYDCSRHRGSTRGGASSHGWPRAFYPPCILERVRLRLANCRAFWPPGG